MPTLCNRIYGDKWGIWVKPVSGDPMAPFDDPTDNWTKVRFHSDLQYLNDSESHSGISLTHQSVAGVTGSGYAPPENSASTGPISNGQILVQDQTLYTHSLGYVPMFQVRYNNAILAPGTVVQYSKADKTVRFASAYATASIIGIRNVGISSSITLASQSTSYDLTIFRPPGVQSGKPLAHIHRDGGDDLIMGHGRITSAMVPLRRRVSGDSLFYMPITRTIDIYGGAVRAISPSGSRDYGGAYGYTGGLIQAAFAEFTR